MDVSIIIVNWNVREFLLKCLETIFKFTENITFEVIIVDNASNDGSTEYLRRQFQPQIQTGQLLIIENRQNLGFAKANNQGLKEAKGEYTLFMNPDMEFTENTVFKLKQYMDSHRDIAACTTKLLYGDRTTQPNIKTNPTICDQVLILLKLHHLFQPKCLKKYLRKDFDYTQESEVDQIMGAFVFIRAEVIRLLDGWNEEYPIWWEDVDLCYNLTIKGQKIRYVPLSEVFHFEGKSFEQKSSLPKQRRFITGMLIFFKKYRPWPQYLLLLILSPISLFLAYIVQLLKIKPRTQSKL
ncbi:TPA: hypothetical protein DF272_03680 [Candidatus Falkowbacteria bacterium]|nr:hypothetical protein [Candidatus Falkowbacteria bacterium]